LKPDDWIAAARESLRWDALSEKALHQETEEVLRVYEETIGCSASRTRQMIGRNDAIRALSKLAISADLQKGFKVLRDRGQLDQTFEALIVKHPSHFTADVVDAAQWRLHNSCLLHYLVERSRYAAEKTITIFTHHTIKV
jgi:hypothetical protein